MVLMQSSRVRSCRMINFQRNDTIHSARNSKFTAKRKGNPIPRNAINLNSEGGIWGACVASSSKIMNMKLIPKSAYFNPLLRFRANFFNLEGI